LAPANDLLGLVIAEGIEKVLAFHEATGLGAWSAGSASRFPKLADVVPAYIECIALIVDDDLDGRRYAGELESSLRDRGFKADQVRLIYPNRWRAA